MLSKKIAVVDRKVCVSCGVCMNTCPLEAMEIWKGCYARPVMEKCVGCGKCRDACPAGCIEIREREAE